MLRCFEDKFELLPITGEGLSLITARLVRVSVMVAYTKLRDYYGEKFTTFMQENPDVVKASRVVGKDYHSDYWVTECIDICLKLNDEMRKVGIL